MATYAGTVERERMTIENNTVIRFDPVKEWEKIQKFEAENPDWKKEESTVCIAFTKHDFWIVPEAE